MSILRIEHLGVRYGTESALAGVSLAVAAGETVALLGRSGSGKSTLAAAALGLLAPAAVMEGRVLVDDVDLARCGERRLRALRGGRIGMVLQDPARALNPVLTIGRQIGEAIRAHRRIGRAALRAEVRRLLDEVGLDVAPGRYPHSLSGGQRQRVAIAAAIAAGPALLLADEPTAALDPLARGAILALLDRLKRERGMGLLLVTHDLATAAAVADRVAVLEAGRLVEEGPAVERLAQPRSAVLGSMVAAERAGAPPPAATAPSPAGTPLLATKALGRSRRPGGWADRRRIVALAGVDLEIRPGETLAVVGASGSGKTTLARLVLGLERPDAGRVRLAGRDRAGAGGAALRTLRAQVQAVFQDPAESLDPALPVGRSVAEPLGLLFRPLSPAARAARVAEALALVGLEADAAARRPDAFSGGQRQRIALARALVLRPPLIVLDEALSALDPELRSGTAALLLRLQAELGLSYLFVAHDFGLVRRLAHRTLVLRDGRVVEQGPTAALLDAPRDAYTAALVAASPGLEAALSRRGSPPPDPTGPASPRQ